MQQQTHHGINQLLPLGCDEVPDAIPSSRQGYSSYEQDDQDHVGEGGCEVHNLFRAEKKVTEGVTREEGKWKCHCCQKKAISQSQRQHNRIISLEI